MTAADTALLRLLEESSERFTYGPFEQSERADVRCWWFADVAERHGYTVVHCTGWQGETMVVSVVALKAATTPRQPGWRGRG